MINISEYVTRGCDCSAVINDLIEKNPNRTLYFPDGEYLLSAPIKTPAEPTKSVSLRLDDFAVIRAMEDFPHGEALVQLGETYRANNTRIIGSNYSFEGGAIDGGGTANGISINGGRETAVRNVSIKNTVVGLHIMYGANSGSSDSDILGLNIIGTGTPDSVGILLEGYDNTVTNVRIGNVFTGVCVKSAGNILRSIHPLYTSDYTDYENSCGFLIENSNNWFDYCYSDQFGIGFRLTGGYACTFHDCFAFWYSSKGDSHTAFCSDERFNSVVTNFKTGFPDGVNYLLRAAKAGGCGSFFNLETQTDKLASDLHKAYDKTNGPV